MAEDEMVGRHQQLNGHEFEKHSTLSCMKKSLKWRLGKSMNPIRWGRQGESKVKQTNKP